MVKKISVYFSIIFAALAIWGCNQNSTANAQSSVNDNVQNINDNLTWLRTAGIYPDSLIIGNTIPSAYSRTGVYLDSLQIQKIIADKIPNRTFLSYSSIRLFSIKVLSDSLYMCAYVYKFSDIEDVYILTYKQSAIVDVLKLPIQETSDVANVIDDVEYIDYFNSSVKFTDNHHFVVTELSQTKGWNIKDGDITDECVFKTSLKKETFYSISSNGKIHRDDVVKTQSCPDSFISSQLTYRL